MATPRDFMARVVPWPGASDPGYINLHWVKPDDGRWRGRPFRDLDQFLDMSAWLTTRPAAARDIYFCLTLQKDTGKTVRGKAIARRNRENALQVKALWTDVDIKGPPNGYNTFEEATDALVQFCHDADLPLPTAMINSGGGMHLYWIGPSVTVTEWEPYALGLKAEMQRLGFRNDLGVIADPARVLRVPGTYNRKTDTPRPVAIKRLVQDEISWQDPRFLRLADIGKKLVPARTVQNNVTAAVTPSEPPFDLTPFANYAVPPGFEHLDPAADPLTANIGKFSDAPLDPGPIMEQCGHMADAFLTGGANHTQGLWMQTVLAATWWDQGYHIARKMSEKHKGFNAAEFDAMYLRKVADQKGGIGWPGCHVFENEGSTACKTCKLRGTIKSPNHLGKRIAAPVTVAVTGKSTALMLPPHYVVNPLSGFIARVVEKPDPQDDSLVKQECLDLFRGRISEPTVQGNPHTLSFIYENGQNRYKVSIADKDMGLDASLMRSLYEQMVKTEPFHEKYVRDFMTAWTTMIENTNKRQNSPAYGWATDDSNKHLGFCFGGTMYTPNGAEVKAGRPDARLDNAYMVHGERHVLDRLYTILHEREHPGLEVIAAQAWAAPLVSLGWPFTTVLWAWSDGSGLQKSTSFMTGLALWGNPHKAKETPSSSYTGIQIKLGALRHIIVGMDDVLKPEELETARKFMHLIVESAAGTKARRDRSLAERLDWHTTCLVCANKSMHAAMVPAGMRADPLRVFEFQLFDKPRPEHHSGIEVDGLLTALSNNHGHYGVDYAKYLGRFRDQIIVRLKEIQLEFMARILPYRADERFWYASCCTTLLGAEIANAIIGRAVFHLPEMWDFLVEKYLANRKYLDDHMPGNQPGANAENMLAAFLQDTINNQLWTDEVLAGRGRPKSAACAILRSPPQNSGRGNPVYIRWCVNARLLQISKARLIAFVQTLKTSAAITEVEQIKTMFKGVQRSKVSLTAGVGGGSVYPSVPEIVIEIPVPPGSPLEPTLMAFRALEDAQTFEGSLAAKATPTESSIISSAVAAGAAALAAVSGPSEGQ